jgi:hypothetical protein
MLREIDGTTIRSNGAAQIVFTRGALFYTNRFNDAGKTTDGVLFFFFGMFVVDAQLGNMRQKKKSFEPFVIFFVFVGTPTHNLTRFTLFCVLFFALIAHPSIEHSG